MFLEHKEQGEVTEAPAKTMKLSAAIRIGAAMRPQCAGRMWREGRSCALGAAYEAVYGPPPGGVWDSSNLAHAHLAPCLTKMRERFGSIVASVWDKNDNEEWTREQIADWLEARGL